MNKEELISKAINGDEESFAIIMDKLKGKAYSMAYGYVRNREDALDIVSEAVCRAFVGVKKIKKAEFFETWFIRIVINTSNDFIRKQKVQALLKNCLSINKSETHREDLLDLRQEIMKIDKKSRNILILRYYHDMTVKEISKILGYPEGTIKSNLNRSKKKLQIALEGNIYDR
ncbi:sigma-70 family RNA polymerase sigma factor [Oceanirhabdus sp. W0125-5]|uniref:sigma-70 family RNA polymerase sigma factor n=1 Tax=Oceanirhabdus sp. W0125-5 TaxID=2999116 RepID=UPI0022F34483|nr:sigma-70 family RNA polymerase sigma factor [Oceanirhabdus sp. W0125-5]WBW99291.1 sigma-70 family RNA polymerase sigma factor [Oceanirhabdus sp. W0125-5]